jgi:putative DNA primase/helicase
MTEDHLATFLEKFRPDGSTTFVSITPDGSTEARTFNGADPTKAEAWIRKQNRNRGVYYTVNSTPADLRKKPTKTNITEINGVWSDIDPLDSNGRSWGEERARLEALADDLHTLPWPPTFVTDSGNGIQPNWLLADPIEANDEYRQAAESLCAQIEASLGARGTHNVDRVLRVPGTRNYPNRKKRELGRGETEARLMRWTWRRYSWTELEQLAEYLRCNPPQHAVPCEPPRQRAALGEVALPEGAPEPLDDQRLAEIKALFPETFDLTRFDGDQSRQDLALAMLAHRLGLSQLDAWRLIIAVRCDQKAYRRDYIDRTLARAYAPKQQPHSEEPWPEPEPLPTGMPPVDPFPMALLPSSIQPWVEDAAERTQAPPDYIAVAAMVALGSILGRQITIRPKLHDDWTVVPNLWGAAVGPPGVLKTPALEEALRHVKAMEIEAKQFFDEEILLWESRAEVEREAKKLRANTIKAWLKDRHDPDAIARDLAADNHEVPPPTRRRFLTNNATIEALGNLLHENPTGILLHRDELIGMLRTLEAEGHEADRAFYLEAWNGTGRFTYDRIGRGTIDIESACISLLGGIQPSPLLSYLSSRAWEGAGADGLLQRFQLIVWPDIASEWRDVDRWPNATARDAARAVFVRFGRIANEIPPGNDRPPFVRFTPDAQRAFGTWRAKLEQRLRAGDLHPAFEAHLAKYRSLLPALALICHLADHEVSPVDGVAFARAEAWTEYLESHARRVYDALIRPDQNAARVLGDHINDLPSPFVLRDAYRPCWAGLTTKDLAQEAVDTLCDLGWIRFAERKPGKSGGRPTAAYHINPAVRKASKT